MPIFITFVMLISKKVQSSLFYRINLVIFIMRKLLYLFLMFFLVVSCSKPAIEEEIPTSPETETPSEQEEEQEEENEEEDTSTTNGYSVSGVIQKGPFVSGSTVVVYELDRYYAETGVTHTTTTTDNLGSYSIEGLGSTLIKVVATGYYYNEVLGKTTTTKISLNSTSYINTGKVVNVNALTTIASSRIKAVAINSNTTYNNARAQAESEVLEAFGISEKIDTYFDEMDISRSGNANAIALAISVILQSDNSETQLSSLISEISSDIATNGEITDNYLKQLINNGNENVDSDQIKNNLISYISPYDSGVEIPNFENYIYYDPELNIEYVTIDISNKDVDSASGSFVVNLQSNSDWSVSDLPSWVTLSAESGNGDSSITVSYSANNSEEDRSATFNFNVDGDSQVLTINQSANSSTKSYDQISFTGSIDSSSDYNGIIMFENNDKISVTAYDNATGLLYRSGVEYIYDGSKFESDSPIEIDSSDNTTQLQYYATYPYTNGGLSFTFTTNSDQSTDNGYGTSDFMSGIISATNSRTPEFTFHHRMVSVCVAITSTELDISDAVVTLYAQRSTECNIQTNSFTGTGDIGTITTFSPGNNCFYAIIPPQTIASGSTFVAVNVDGTDYYAEALSDIEMNSGSQAFYSLSFNKEGVSFNGDINPWGDGE